MKNLGYLPHENLFMIIFLFIAVNVLNQPVICIIFVHYFNLQLVNKIESLGIF